MNYETIKEFNSEGFQIVYSITPEDTHPRDLFMEEDVEDICRRIDSGSLYWFIARVQAFKKGILLGADYLGGCCYENPSQIDYLEDMTQEAIRQAKQTLEELKETS
jgi:hypothetical protein